MTIDEAIKHCLEVAKKEEYCYICDTQTMMNGGSSHAECAADHRQLAEWLMELKDLRAEQNEQYVFIRELMDELEEAKRLLKLALQDMNGNNICDEENACNACKYGSCVICSAFEWQYTAEALNLLGGSENENNK